MKKTIDELIAKIDDLEIELAHEKKKRHELEDYLLKLDWLGLIKLEEMVIEQIERKTMDY